LEGKLDPGTFKETYCLKQIIAYLNPLRYNCKSNHFPIQFMHKRFISIFLFILLLTIEVSAEMINIGVPYIHNFPRREYKGGTQNWAIAQDQRGFMYFGNNEGLLVFDGVSWQKHRMPNSSIVRSICIAKNGQIYVGAYNELGKMEVGHNGKMEFRSLKKFLPAGYVNFDDVWNITVFQDQIVFQSYNFAFLFKNDSTVSIIKAPSRFQNSFEVNNRLYFNDQEKGLMEFAGNSLHELRSCEKIKGEEIWSVIPFNRGNNLMIFTLNKGVFIYNGIELKEWDVAVNTLFKQKQIFSAIVIQDNYYAVGTIQDGIIIIDESGNIIQHINRQKGLQNNTILKVFADRVGNLWLGLDNGIDYVNVNSPITFLQQNDRIGAGYTSLIHHGKIYLGTNQGLFVKDWGTEQQNKDFHLVPGTNGQVWYLGVHDNILLCGHNNGTFVIEGEKARQISQIPGAWKFHSLKRFPEYLIGGTYSGLTLYKKQNGNWVYSGKIGGFIESFRVFEEDDNGNLWMSHGFKGIYKINIGSTLDSIQSFRYYTTQDGLPSNYNLNVFKVKGKILITTSVGFFEYNNEKDRFESSTYFNQLLSPLKDVSFLKEDQVGNIWYMAWDMGKIKAGVFRIQEDNSYNHISAPFGLLTGRFISGFESVYCYSNEHIFFGTEEGFAHYSPLSNFNNGSEFSTYINRATALYLDSTFFYGNSVNKPNEISHTDFESSIADKANYTEFSFPFKENTFRFSYTSPVYDNQDNIEYSFKLSGYNNKWSKWSNIPFNEYANLPPGEYTFSVKARNQIGIESTTDNLKFSVLPPWYKTTWAYAIYTILLLIFIVLLIWYILKRIEISKRKERLKHLQSYRQKEREYKQEALIAEKKIINLKNEKLKIEMIHRDKELANQTMDLIRKNKFLQKIKDELEKLKMMSSDESIKDKISSIMTKIDKDIDHKKQWEVFETAFDEVHEDFLSRLKVQYPNLTPKEIKLCAYLRMNISTKEIAPLMNISVRGVEICRYRVRKKLNIDRDQNLTSMIIDL
jgi:ligand-binding sensor domain-containing protein/DNA-binding CsgD family transcriptional regulator